MAGTSYDTWLRVFPGTYQENGGEDDCANGNEDNGVNCASCDDCGGSLQTVLTMRVTNPGWYTFLVEGCECQGQEARSPKKPPCFD